MCPRGKATPLGSRTQFVREYEIKEERDALEMRKIDACDMENFSTLHSSEKTIAILGDRWWPQKAKREGHTIRKKVGRG